MHNFSDPSKRQIPYAHLLAAYTLSMRAPDYDPVVGGDWTVGQRNGWFMIHYDGPDVVMLEFMPADQSAEQIEQSAAAARQLLKNNGRRVTKTVKITVAQVEAEGLLEISKCNDHFHWRLSLPAVHAAMARTEELSTGRERRELK